MKYEITGNKEEESAHGMRVKLTFTFTGAGQMSTPYVTVTGLTPRDFPPKSCPSRVLPVPIPGLCIECIGWNDGDVQQLKSTCKQSAKRSGVEQ
eukprot:9218807-Ditylum_brightwellii.AAC.1